MSGRYFEPFVPKFNMYIAPPLHVSLPYKKGIKKLPTDLFLDFFLHLFPDETEQRVLAPIDF